MDLAPRRMTKHDNGGNAEKEEAHGCLPTPGFGGFICFMFGVALHLGYPENKGLLTCFGLLLSFDPRGVQRR